MNNLKYLCRCFLYGLFLLTIATYIFASVYFGIFFILGRTVLQVTLGCVVILQAICATTGYGIILMASSDTGDN